MRDKSNSIMAGNRRHSLSNEHHMRGSLDDNSAEGFKMELETGSLAEKSPGWRRSKRMRKRSTRFEGFVTESNLVNG